MNINGRRVEFRAVKDAQKCFILSRICQALIFESSDYVADVLEQGQVLSRLSKGCNVGEVFKDRTLKTNNLFKKSDLVSL